MQRFQKLFFILFTILSLGCAGLAGWVLFSSHYCFIDHKPMKRSTTTLSYRGKTAPPPEELEKLPNLQTLDITDSGLRYDDYLTLKAALPDCEITWEFPFQGAFYPLDTHGIQVDHLTEEEAVSLDLLTELYHVSGWDCRDYEALQFLQNRRPECNVEYRIFLGDDPYYSDETAITVSTAPAQELLKNLQYIPNLQEVTLGGYIPSPGDMITLQDAYPQITFYCNLPAGPLVLDPREIMLDLSGQNLTAGQVREMLAYFPDSAFVNLLDSPLADEEKRELMDAYPERFFQTTLDIAGKTIQTDAPRLDLDGVPMEDTQALLEMLPYFPMAKTISLCGSGLENEVLADLNEQLSDIRVVWEVQLGAVSLRTDATWFMPGKTHQRVWEGDLQDLRYCTDLVCIDLGHMKIENVDFLAYMPELQYLVLADTNVRDISPIVNCKKIVFLELFLTQIRDLSPLKELTALEDLNLCYVPGNPEPIGEMTWLKRLWWSGGWLARTTLPEKLTSTELNFTSGSSTGDTWRMGKRYYEMRDILGMGYMVG